MDLSILLALILGFLLVLFLYMRRTRGYLESLGIPISKPLPFLGSPPYFYHDTMVHEFFLAEAKKYGKTWGRYQGIHPVINTIDPEILKEIFVKSFDKFHDTFNVNLEDRHMTIDFAKGETWKILRKAMSPIFSSGKLKGEPLLIFTLSFAVDSMTISSSHVGTHGWSH